MATRFRSTLMPAAARGILIAAYSVDVFAKSRMVEHDVCDDSKHDKYENDIRKKAKHGALSDAGEIFTQHGDRICIGI